MKCKVNETPNNGRGRPRASLISAIHTSTRSSKVNNNDVNTVRRSSRRATIERRVWAVPKKGSKFTGTASTPSAKKKDNNQTKRDRKPSSSSSGSKVEVRITSKSKSSQGYKREISSIDDVGHNRKKVKKKSSAEDVSSNSKDFPDVVNNTLFREMPNSTCFCSDSDSLVLDNSSSCRREEENVDLKYDVCKNMVKEGLVYIDERTGNECTKNLGDSEKEVEKTSPVNVVDSNCDLGKEETMCLDDVSLHRAVIVEVISDYDALDIKENSNSKEPTTADCKEMINHKVHETGFVVPEESCMLKESGSVHSYSTSLQDSEVEGKIENENSFFVSDENKSLGVENKPQGLSVPEPKPSVCSSLQNSSNLHKFTTKILPPALDISGVMSVYDPAFDVGADPHCSTSRVLSDSQDLAPELKCRSTCVKDSSECNCSGIDMILDGMVTLKKDCCSSGQFNISKSVLISDSSIIKEKEDVCSQKPEVENDNKLGQNNYGTSASQTKNDTDQNFSDTSYFKLVGFSTQDSKEQDSLDTQQCNRDFDPGGVRNDICLQSQNDGDRKFDVRESTSAISCNEFRCVSSTDDDDPERTIYGNIIPVKLVSSSSVIGVGDRDIVKDTKDINGKIKISQEVTQWNSGDLCSARTHKIGNACIPELATNLRRVSSMKKICNENGSQHMPLQLSVDSEGGGEEDHVSLSVALAQLVDAGCTDEAGGEETLTIHSAAAVVTQINENRKGVLTVECDLEGPTKNELVNEEDAEEEEGKLFIKEEEEYVADAAAAENDDESYIQEEEEEDEDIIELEEQATFKRSSSEREQPRTIRSDILEDVSSLEKVCDVGETQPQNSQKPKKQLPPLIKISSRPPTIKTPLKCPECPMQFCTVRSLFWHFGLHGARSRDTSLPPILLQDLIVPWDKPSISLFLSQAQDLLEKAEKSVQIQELDRSNDIDETRLGGNITTDSFSSLVMSASSASLPIVSSTLSSGQPVSSLLSVSSAFEISTKLDKNLEKGQKLLKEVKRTEEKSSSCGDVILKIPIPRLKRKLQSSKPVKVDKFVNILPKLPSQRHVVSQSSQASTPQPNTIRASNSPPPQVTIQPSSPLDLVTVTPQQPSLVPKITVIPSSNSQVQIQPLSTSAGLLSHQSAASNQSFISSQPLLSSSQLVSSSCSSLSLPSSLGVSVSSVVTNAKSNSSTHSQFTLIPVDDISSVNSNSQGPLNSAPLKVVTPSQPPPTKVANPIDGMVEKDGLVMINSNLALRIVSTLPSTLDTTTNTTNSTTFHPISNPSVNNLTILPQVEGSRPSSIRETTKNPDILTIVPQVDLKKRLSLLKRASPVPSCPTSSGTQTSCASGSQVVKLYLLQSKESCSQSTSKVSMIPEALKNLNGVEFKPLSILNGKEKVTGENGIAESISDEEEEEEDERKMVIADIKEEVEDDLMDPLSLCAVTMEDEHLESSNHGASVNHSNVPTTAVIDDRGNSEKIEVKVRGKKEKLDIVKYEARKYVCCYCNRRFGWSTDLKRHVILHTGERPFQCKVCPTAFTRKFLLQNHMKRMHPDKCKMSDLWP